MFIKTRSVVAKADQFPQALDLAHRIAAHLNEKGIETEVSTTLFDRPREIHFTSRHKTMEAMLGESSTACRPRRSPWCVTPARPSTTSF
jgi:hypothetical protein